MISEVNAIINNWEYTMKNYLLISSMLLSVILSSSLMAKPTAWSCGKWKKDPKGKCEEIQLCTRTVCDTSGENVGNCRTETKTNCANPIPPKSIKPNTLRKIRTIKPDEPSKLKFTPPEPPVTPPGVPVPYPNTSKKFNKTIN